MKCYRPYCKEEAVESRSMCQYHLTMQTESHQNRMSLKGMKQLCTYGNCPEEAVNLRFCNTHRLWYNSYQREYKKKKKELFSC